MRPLRRLPVTRAMIAATFAIVIAAAPARASAPQALPEPVVKAAYVFNFARFVEWPASALDRELVVCYAGEASPLFRELGSIEGKTAHGRPLALRRVAARGDLAGCAILVIGGAEPGAPRRALAEHALAQGTLTIGEADGFAQGGGMIGLVTVDGRVAFELNLDAARAAGLRIPAQLARLGRVVVMPK